MQSTVNWKEAQRKFSIPLPSGVLMIHDRPGAMHLIHFQSRDLAKLHVQGQFWHIFFTSGAALISQDEKDTWTIHIPVPIGTDISGIEPKQAIYKALGGEHSPVEIEIDEILVTSIWRPNIYLANKYQSEHSRVFISGDSAHQNIPTGGYGMNTAVGDSFDIGWKVAAVLHGHGGKYLLDSYEIERRPVAARNIERSGVHFGVHMAYWGWVRENPGLTSSETEESELFRKKIAKHVQEFDGENRDLGVELGYRYNGSPVVVGEKGEEPEWRFKEYVPSTWPGARAPHVFLKDGRRSIYDLFGVGNQYTLVDFTSKGSYVESFEVGAKKMGVPLKTVHLPEETHVRRIWERDAVLVRPDDHVAWRAQSGEEVSADLVEEVLGIATGKKRSKSSVAANGAGAEAPKFTSVGVEEHGEVEDLAAFQK
jgi:hypothetical protein